MPNAQLLSDVLRNPRDVAGRRRRDGDVVQVGHVQQPMHSSERHVDRIELPVARRRRDHDDDRLPDDRMRHAERRCLADELRRVQRLLDFGGAHPISGRLDHLVAPADEVEEPVLVRANRVAREHRMLGQHQSALPRAQRPVALRGLLRVVPVSETDERAAMHELAGLVGRADFAIRPHHEDLRIRDRLADRVGAAVEFAGIEIGRAERLGQAVHQVQPCIRKQRPESSNDRLGKMPAAVRQDSKRRTLAFRPVGLRELQPQGRNAGKDGDVMASHRPDDVSRQEIIEGDCLAARGPGGEQLVLSVIERQREDSQRAVPPGQAKIVRDTDGAEPEVGVAQHDPLGLAGRTGRVEERCEFIGVTIRRRQCISSAAPFLQCVELCICGVARFKRMQARCIADQQLRAAVRQDMRGLRSLQHRVDRYMHKTRPRRGQRQNAGQRRFGHPARNAIARLQALLEQGRGGASDLLFQPGVGKGRTTRGQRRRIGHATARQAIEREWSGIRSRHCK